MKKERNELLEFLGGLAMLIAGGYMFASKVVVTSGFFGMISFGGLSVPSGMVVIPFIIGVVWMFANPDSFAAKLVAGLGLLLIVVAVIISTHLSLLHTTLFDWIVMLVLIFGGLGLLARILFKNPKKNKKDEDDKINY